MNTLSRTNDREELSSGTAAAGVKNEIYLVVSDRWLAILLIPIFVFTNILDTTIILSINIFV